MKERPTIAPSPPWKVPPRWRIDAASIEALRELASLGLNPFIDDIAQIECSSTEVSIAIATQVNAPMTFDRFFLLSAISYCFHS
jgi:hypothetical protein